MNGMLIQRGRGEKCDVRNDEKHELLRFKSVGAGEPLEQEAPSSE